MDRVDELAHSFKALSDPTRLRVVRLLHQHGGTLCVNALAHKLGVSQSAISQHLRVLRQVRLVEGMRQGYHVHYALHLHRLQRYKDEIKEVLGAEFVVHE